MKTKIKLGKYDILIKRGRGAISPTSNFIYDDEKSIYD